MLHERYDTVNGLRIHSYTCGDPGGMPVILLHGFPEWGGAWDAQLRFLGAQGCYAIAPDQRGYHLSAKPPGVKAYTADRLAGDIAMLIETLALGPVTLVGHDWGGGVAWELVRSRPELIRRLVILNMPHPGAFRETLRMDGRQRRKSWYVAFFQLPWLPERACAAFGFAMLRCTLLRSSRRGTFTDADLAEYRAAWSQPGALRSMLHWYRAVRHYRPGDFTVELPTLLLWGKQDAFLDAVNAERSLARCRQGRLEWLDEATHWLHHEEPERVSRAILDFMKDAQRQR